MDKWFVVILGTLVAALYIPPIVAPSGNRQLARKILADPKILRCFGAAMVAIGVCALLLGNNTDVHHWILFVGGIVETLFGIILLAFPSFLVSVTQIRVLASKSLKAWIVRGVLKFGLGVAIALWGVIYF